ncbi:MAG: hypothetical protein JSV04_01740 [Candidatus Heimdallarchaeota archaeon]|nr:MAG: hypothetical protein JSV04_01740 [Candidatus Heimdallarchaeota archaeon]
MTIHRWISIKCPCNHVFDFMLPQSITTWLYPEMVQTLVDGGYYQTSCPECRKAIIIEGELMVNAPQGIVLIRTGPPEELKEILYRLEIVDETGKPFSSQEISDRLKHNLNNLDDNPFLKKQRELFEDQKNFLAKFKKEENEKEKK